MYLFMLKAEFKMEKLYFSPKIDTDDSSSEIKTKMGGAGGAFRYVKEVLSHNTLFFLPSIITHV